MPFLQFSNYNKYGNIRTRTFYHPTTSISYNPSGFGKFTVVRCFKYRYEHPVMPPSLFVNTNGEKYIVPTWQKVHPKTRLEDIDWIKPKKKKTNVFKQKTWKFESSSSDSVYTVTQVDSKTLKCSCPGAWRSKGNCKHIKEVRASLTK